MTTAVSPAAKTFSYGEVISVLVNGAGHNCYCIDANTAKRISSLPRRKSRSLWRASGAPPEYFPQMRYPFRGSLTVWEDEHGYFAYRWFRSSGRRRNIALAHQLSGLPIIFPSAELGQAAAELCFPTPHRAAGYLWWTYPNFHLL
jgi:hypothetical protein